ncbi:DnaJ C-terminal domain-containing protein [Bartonella sp. DGB1]|uniref:DnaJ C-terminal domain-containing protein n=1 Tax=Bartonella sp. DGB1 TaxID=3239807 RepID=UPI0035251183
MEDLYKVLEVSRNATATEIKSSFRKLAKKYHPDQNKDDPKAKERFAKISSAYEILGDKNKKQQYDNGEIDAEGKPKAPDFSSYGFGNNQGGFNGFSRQSTAGFEDIFSELFSSMGSTTNRRPDHNFTYQSASPKVTDIEINLTITLEQLMLRDTTEVTFPNGRKIKIKLPDYIEDGQVIRLKGQGEVNSLGKKGDALIKIKIKHHDIFEVKNRNLYMDLAVTLKEAVLGAKKEISTLTGKLSVKIPEWSSSGKIFRIPGKGLKLKKGGFGDLYLKLMIILPDESDQKLKDFLSNN